MKTLKLTLAAVVLSAFTMTAQQDVKAATTKTEASKEVKAPHKVAEQNKADKKVAVKPTTVRDSDAAAQVAPGTATKKDAKMVKSKKAVLSQDEKAAKAAKATKKKKGN